jgi:hypothetical protein
MAGHSTGPNDNIAPVATPDSFARTAQDVTAVETVEFSYVDPDPDSPTYGQIVTGVKQIFGTRLDVTLNDTDDNPNDSGKFWIFDLTQPVDSAGNSVGEVRIETGADNRQYVRYYNSNPDEAQPTQVSFSYRAGDQWATGAPNDPSISGVVTVTLKIGGNAYPGQVLTGLNPPNVFTPDSKDPRILNRLQGNDTITGGNNKDIIDGGAGADKIYGLNGNDSLNGGAGADHVFGGNGSDTINGGAGNDILSGGLGPDRFVFEYGFGNDTITDFDVKTDKVVVDHNMWGSWQSFIGSAQATPDGKGVVVTSMIDGASITFENLTLATLKKAESAFVFGLFE